MILFVISFLLVFINSYLLTSIIAPKKSILGIIYLFLIAFAQIVLTFEILSLFSAITKTWVISGNLFFAAISGYLWNKNQRPIFILDCKDFKNRLINSMKLDKSLIWLCFGFCIFLFVSLFLCLIMPTNNGDGVSYHVARSFFWVLQGNLNHFDVADIRNLCLPINSEILYSWVLLFLKKDLFLGLFSFSGYLLSIISIYNILGLLGYCVRKRLWVIFILSSLPSVLVQVSTVETDIIIAGLISSSVFLFWHALKNNKKMPIYMASLAYALAIGTKTPAIIMIPGVGLLFLALCFYFKKFKPLSLFLGFGLINFLFFSSYNYILNYMHFNDFMGAQSFIVINKNYYGIKGAVSNFVKHMFLFVDFTGFKWSLYLNPYIQTTKMAILNLFNAGALPNSYYTSGHDVDLLLTEQYMSTGVLGFLVYLPCLIWSFFKFIFKPRLGKSFFIFVFSALFTINLFVLSYIINFSTFDVRYLVSFIVLSSPILVYSYWRKCKPLKCIIILFSLYSLLIISTNLWPRPFFKIIKILREHPSIEYVREVSRCKGFKPNPKYTDATCMLKDRVKQEFTPDNKILVFLNAADNIYSMKTLVLEGYDIDLKTMEDAPTIDFSKYNVLILTGANQTSTFIKSYTTRKDDFKMVGNDLVDSKKHEVPCVYLLNPRLQDIKGTTPYAIQCAMSDKFIEENHFKLYSAFGLVKPQMGSAIYYYVYINQNLPMHVNKTK